jgi:hypothetical protein
MREMGAVPYGGFPLSGVEGGRRRTKRAEERHRAIGYCRVSTADQADFGVSLDAQTEKIRGWSVANGYELVESRWLLLAIWFRNLAGRSSLAARSSPLAFTDS